MSLPGTRFETELQVRPDDIDMYQHVHGSRYFDYVAAARYDQMVHGYKLAMEEFARAGYGWVVRTAHLEYQRSLRLGDHFLVRTWVAEFFKDGVKVEFEILKQVTSKRVCTGYFHYTMIDLKTGRAATLPDWAVAAYSV
jgi:YbgC/YbaW family acyl-CoA thioester hydrolase